MDALHAIWTEPLSDGKAFYMEDYEILTMVLSALTWKKHNGSIKIVADEKAIEFLEKTNLISIYNEIEYLVIDEKINPETFWASGKIFALQAQSKPCVVIDTDFIVWKNIDKLLDSDIVAAHEEKLESPVYPDFDYFKMDNVYRFNCENDSDASPYNTAFLFIRDNLFKNYYVSESINFMRHCKEKENDICSMVFAEQRMLGICASHWNMPVRTLMKKNELNLQKSFTHLWGYKEVLRKNSLKRNEYCRRCLRRIKNDYPEILNTLSNIPQLENYFD